MTVASRDAVGTREWEKTRAAWDTIAPGYDALVTPSHLCLGSDAMRRAGLAPPMRFLDVAAGAGALTIPAARLGARVLSIDLSPAMLERLRARAEREGLVNVETRVMDGHSLELDDDTFDVAGSQHGITLFPDLSRAMRELVRVTRRTGRVLVVAYGAPDEVEFLAFFLAAIHAVVPDFTGIPEEALRLSFQVAEPASVHHVLAESGLREIRVETVTERREFRSGAGMWNWVVNSSPSLRALIADVSAEEGVEVRKVLDGMLRERSGGNGAAMLTNPVHIGIGVK